MQWYLAKYKEFAFYNSTSPKQTSNYLGLAGDIWPITGFDSYKNEFPEVIDCYREIEKRLIYLELEPNIYIYMLSDLALARRYAKLLAASQHQQTIVLNVSNDLNKACDGFDFGNPEGSYSIIATGILGNKAFEKHYLNANRLFRSVALFKEFIEQINIDEFEDLDNYHLLSIKVLNMSKRNNNCG